MLASFIHYEAVWGKQDMDVEHWERSEELMEHRLCGYPKMERLRMVPFRFLGTPLGKTCSRRIMTCVQDFHHSSSWRPTVEIWPTSR
jgi:hypothetical protein